jgi:hypothetical protein
MAAYTTEARLQAALGTAYLAAATSFSTTPLTTLIASASDVVAGYIRNSGYTPPSDADLSAIDQTVCLATEALVAQAIASIPEVSQPLPDNWDKSMQVIALEGILSGDVVLNLSLSNISAVGGTKFTDSDPTLAVADGGRPQRASRKELASY